MAPQAAAQERAPFSYVGTLDQGKERYAVLVAQDQSVLLVRAGETINSQYRVQSIAGERLLIVNIASGKVQELALPVPGSSVAPAPAPEAPREPSAPQEPAVETAPSAAPTEGARPGYEH